MYINRTIVQDTEVKCCFFLGLDFLESYPAKFVAAGIFRSLICGFLYIISIGPTNDQNVTHHSGRILIFSFFALEIIK